MVHALLHALYDQGSSKLQGYLLGTYIHGSQVMIMKLMHSCGPPIDLHSKFKGGPVCALQFVHE